MKKEFNDTGACIPARHYMVDTGAKIKSILALIEKGKYFTLNRPRQFGKTTTISLLANELLKKEDYVVIRISLEGIGDALFDSREAFCERFVSYLNEELEFMYPQLMQYVEYEAKDNTGFDYLSRLLTRFVRKVSKKIVLIIDEVDKSSDNQLFLHFLGMLRDKYLKQNESRDLSFHSVILAGVHDVKTLKLKINAESTGKLNSPWNIAVDFTVDMSFNAEEIASMLTDYAHDNQIEMDEAIIAQRIYYYTSGYPYLVSKMCKVVDEIILPKQLQNTWTVLEIEKAYEYLVNKGYTTTLFDDIIKNLENNPQLFDFVFEVLMGGKQYTFDIDNPQMNLAYIYGIIDNQNKIVKIHNRIFDQRLSAYMVSKLLTGNTHYIPNTLPDYYTSGGLNLTIVLKRFQQFMRENYAQHDEKFLEREGRLL